MHSHQPIASLASSLASSLATLLTPAFTHRRPPSDDAEPLTLPLPSPTERWLDVEGRRFLLRPLRADDTALLGQLWNDHLSRPARFNRFHASLGRFSPERLQGLCEVPPAQGGAFLITQLLPGGEVALAEGRWAWCRRDPAAGSEGLPPGPRWAALSVSVADHWQGRGLGRRMVHALTAAARQQGAQVIQAQVLPGNAAMQALLEQVGYTRCNSGAGPGTGFDTDADTDNFEHRWAPQRRSAAEAATAVAWAAHAKRHATALLQALHRRPWAQGTRQRARAWLDHVAATVVALQLGWHFDQQPGAADLPVRR